MGNLQLAYTIVPIFAILYLGIVIYLYDKKNISNKLFFLISLATVLWGVSNYYSLIPEQTSVLFWARTVLFFATCHVVLFFIFTYNFPSPILKLSKKVFYGLLALMFITMAATESPFVFSRIDVSGHGPVAIPGPLIVLFAATILGCLVASLMVMINKYLKATAKEKEQWRLLLIGTSLSYTVLIFTNFVLSVLLKNTDFNLYGPVYMLPMFIGMAYAILNFKLLNAKAIAVEVLTFFILLLSLFEIFHSRSLAEVAVQSLVFVLFAVFGILLIKSVLREVEQREKIEKQEKELEVINAKLNETNTQLGVANERLRELDKQKSEFVSMASHQLRSPLTAIKGYASLILDGDYGVVTDDLKHAVKIIFDSAQTLATVVSDYLNVTRIELGKMKYDLTNFDLRDLVVAVTEELRPNIEKAGLKLDFTCDTSRHYNVNADKEKLKQVLMNLIDNSVKYTPKGSVHVSLEQKPGRQVGAGSALFAVKDTGIGIHKDVLPKLFGKFSRADNAHTRDIRGTGLGLYIAKQIVEAHQGKIWAESAGEEKGSQFYLELPMV